MSNTNEKTTEQHMVEYVKSLAALDECISPYREQRKDLRKSYVENGWLDKDQIKLAIKAYRLHKDSVDFENLQEAYDAVSGNLSEDE